MQPTNTQDPQYYHRVVDCQWACPAHTNVPEYIRLIADGKYTESYMLNRKSNVFPGILGRTCDRPCEPACRRVRVEDEPVAICRLKRVAADLRDEVKHLIPTAPAQKNGKRVALVGAGPASLTVANDLLPLGYEVVIYEGLPKAGGLMRTNIPSFRLPVKVLEEEIDYILDMGAEIHYEHRIESLKDLLDTDEFDAVFVGTGAPKGKELNIPGREEADANIHIGIEWLESLHFEHIDSIGEQVLVIGVGNTAMDCCRSSLRVGGKDVKVMARKSRPYFKASPWELEDAEEEKVEILVNHSPASFVVEDGKLKGMMFDLVEWEENEKGRLVSTKTGEKFIEADDVILAIGQDNAFPWIERDIGIEFGEWDMPVVDRATFMTTREGVFVGGDAAWGPENIIWAVEHGHQAAISMHQHCQGESVTDRPPYGMNLVSTKMGLHEWRYSNDYNPAERTEMRYEDLEKRLMDMHVEAELGFDIPKTAREVQRCLNCDIQTDFTAKLCIECDACIDICPVSCLTMTENGEEAEIRLRLMAPAENLDQALYVSDDLPQTGRIMAKDEDLCVHCGLCAERCPTAAWDMLEFDLINPHAGHGTWSTTAAPV
ncbi:MAG: FAD-dependent oxidoreductase [Gemmatimonadales bacterium]|jgi:NADPH-dependent glutamate synthase beta subunit-like oxidoreductase/ferredoxin|nr:FAD-dependent oxidoreductase [Gemmatimonadales bacterium]MDG2241714.1 FAD-dependent oxidoreductase [Longimicrobiales bacterium]NCG32662.1 FAD-dependent oxidoreductase [Pseudomonadota bacterium]MBT3498585.1 FAD-dependent oxidoreductase [Gemmatimonadales bacterium]MBT3773227.1 FAD-dependent oxidoreductase [Gemmatimonadales bacterium]